MKLPCSLCALNSKALFTNWHNPKDILYSVECVARVSFMNTRAVYIYFMGRYIFCTSMANRINALQKYNMIMLHNGQFSTMLIVFSFQYFQWPMLFTFVKLNNFCLNLFRPNYKLTLVRLHFHVLWQQSLLVQIQIFASFLALADQMVLLLGLPTSKTNSSYYKVLCGMVWMEKSHLNKK